MQPTHSHSMYTSLFSPLWQRTLRGFCEARGDSVSPFYLSTPSHHALKWHALH